VLASRSLLRVHNTNPNGAARAVRPPPVTGRAASLISLRPRHPLALIAVTIGVMRGLLFAAAVLVVAVLLDSSLYDSRYLNAAMRMVGEISVSLWGK
jgi:hypothetical protein